MKILITNDDGMFGVGLRPLRNELTKIGEVIVVVPDRPRSACSHSVTLHKPLRLEAIEMESGWQGYICNGTPADCVALAIEALHIEPDLVVSGINLGPNLGDDVTYSGTVAGAMEGAIFDIKSLAVSLVTGRKYDCAFAAQFTRQLAELVVQQPLSPNTLLNVNIPALPPEDIKGIEVTRTGHRRWIYQMHQREDPRGEAYWWRGGQPQHDESEIGTDIAAVSQGKISITPIHMDLTDYKTMEGLREWNIHLPQ
jgi:5'-nucleotidase